ncbi:MAG: hypothetical protein A2X12_04460 [Bacteroidetes bacterium GWE2_29_8]|nr:MAG: hypothetical protein A2X12_04460 [Bacteroidetes bacterium GWE2_29_8]OFY18605.1 MAG: hypothetical protein A2X02_07460 [Bacteroidetes bacterium GWF2_29_10]
MKYIFYLTIIAIVLLTGCEEKIDLKIDSGYDKLVVEGEITTEKKAHIVKLTKTASYFSNQQTPKVSNAKVIISDGTQIFPLTEISPGIYATNSNIMGEIGKTYTLTIENIDINDDGTMDSYSASSTITQSVKPDSLSFEKTKGNGQDDQSTDYISINLWAFEPATVGDNYFWSYSVNGNLETDTISKAVFTEDDMVNGRKIENFPLFYNEKLKVGDTITLRTASISRDYLDFLYGFMTETDWNMGNFGGPPANIKGNISNGALGFFNASDVNYFTRIVKLE